MASDPNYRWPDERTALLKELWGTNKSAAEIGAILGLTRNAVIGKANRLGLVGPTRRQFRLAGLQGGRFYPLLGPALTSLAGGLLSNSKASHLAT